MCWLPSKCFVKAVKCLGYSARFPFPQRAYVNCSRSKTEQRAIFRKAVVAGGGKEPGPAGGSADGARCWWEPPPARFRWLGSAV